MILGAETEGSRTQPCPPGASTGGEADFLTEKLCLCQKKAGAVIETSIDCYEKTRDRAPNGGVVKEGFTTEWTFMLS